MHFQSSLSLWELQVTRDWLYVRNIAETSLNRLLLILILKSSHRSYSVEKGILKNFTGKHFSWSLFLIKLQARAWNTAVFHWKEHLLLKTTLFFLSGMSTKRLVPRWLSCFKVLHYDHLLLCRANAEACSGDIEKNEMIKSIVKR